MGAAMLRLLMPDAPYARQVFVCTYGAWCRIEGSEEIRAALKDAVKAAGLASECRVTKSGCLGQCGHGPTMVTWPDNVWHAHVKLTDVPEIVDVHIKGKRPVERLRYRPEKPGTNKTPEVIEKEAKTHSKVE